MKITELLTYNRTLILKHFYGRYKLTYTICELGSQARIKPKLICAINFFSTYKGKIHRDIMY